MSLFSYMLVHELTGVQVMVPTLWAALCCALGPRRAVSAHACQGTHLSG